MLSDLPTLARSHDVQAPALLVVGEVAALAEQLHWFGRAPLTTEGAGYEAVLPVAGIAQAA